MTKNKALVSCTNCEYYDYDEEYGEYVCNMNLDEDEMARLSVTGSVAECPYFKFYDEYKSVQKQN